MKHHHDVSFRSHIDQDVADHADTSWRRNWYKNEADLFETSLRRPIGNSIKSTNLRRDKRTNGYLSETDQLNMSQRRHN